MAKKQGRPKGKRSNPDYVQISAYIPVKVYRATKIRCFEQDLELSQVVETLLSEWLRTQNDGNSSPE